MADEFARDVARAMVRVSGRSLIAEPGHAYVPIAQGTLKNFPDPTAEMIAAGQAADPEEVKIDGTRLLTIWRAMFEEAGK